MSTIQPYILGIEGMALTERERALFGDAPPFGVILFLRNVDNPDQLAALIGDIKGTTKDQTLIVIDQEGGRVQRLAPPYWPQYPIACNFDHIDGEEFKRAVYVLYRLISDDLVRAKIDINCAPCLDLRSEVTATFLQDRTFGTHAPRIIAAGHAAVQAMNEAGIAPVIKHLPGHGLARVDSHVELPKVRFDSDPYTFSPADIEIFKVDYGVKMAMNAHILYTQIDEEYPLTLSPKGIEFIRKQVGFKGLIMSDDLAMKALNGTQGDLAARAFEAGLDVALSCSGKIEDIEAIYALNVAPNELVKRTHGELLALGQQRGALLSDQMRQDLMAELENYVRV